MKLFLTGLAVAALSFALVPSSVFANTLKCSSADQSVKYDEWWYSGGAAPPPEMVTHTLETTYNAKPLPAGAKLEVEASGTREVRRTEDKAANTSYVWFTTRALLTGI